MNIEANFPEWRRLIARHAAEGNPFASYAPEGKDVEEMMTLIERLRKQSVEDLKLAHEWMTKHDRLLGFIQARPDMLKELIAESLALEQKADHHDK